MAAKRVLDEYNVENLEMTFHEANAKRDHWAKRTSTLEMDIWTGLFLSQSRYRLSAKWKLIPDIIAYILAPRRTFITERVLKKETVKTFFGEKDELSYELEEQEVEAIAEGCIIVEAETDPKKGILANEQRILGYRMIRANFDQERPEAQHDFPGTQENDHIAKIVLAIYDDIKFPKGTKKDPLPPGCVAFDEIWRMPRGVDD